MKSIASKKQDLIFSTRCSDVYRAEVDKQAFLNWKLKYPIDEAVIKDLEERLKTISSVTNLVVSDSQVLNAPSVLVKYLSLIHI